MEDIYPEYQLNFQEAAMKGRTKKEMKRIILIKGSYNLSPESQ